MEPMIGMAVFFGVMALAAFLIAFIQYRGERDVDLDKTKDDIKLQAELKKEQAKQLRGKSHLNAHQIRMLEKGNKKGGGGYIASVQGHFGMGVCFVFMGLLLLTVNEVFLWLALATAVATVAVVIVQWAKKNRTNRRF